MSYSTKERLDRQINVRFTTGEHEYLTEWAARNLWATGMLARLILREAIRVHAMKTGKQLPPGLEDVAGEAELLAKAI